MHHKDHSYLIIGGLLPLLMALPATEAGAQTNPAPQPLPYAQDFGAWPHNVTTLPTGWHGWRVGNAASSSFETAAPLGDLATIPNSTAANSDEGIHNYNGKPGVLNSGSLNAAVTLAINTTNRHTVQVDYTLMTIRNPWNGITNTRISEATLQYRVGTSGPFTTLPAPVYTTLQVQQTGNVTTPQNPQPFTVQLPVACSDKPVVQLRWVARDASIVGTGMRPSVAVDDVSVTGICVAPTIAYTGSPYCSNGGINGGHAFPTITGSGTGVFSAPGMNIAPTTGAIHLATSSSGTVFHTIAAGNGCPAVEASTEVTINPAAQADAGGPYASLDGAPVLLNATANGPGTWSGGEGTFDQPTIPITQYTPHVNEWSTTVQLTWTTNDPDGGGPCGAVSATAQVIGDLSVYAIMYGGGDGRGDATGSAAVEPVANHIFSGGDGRGDVAVACMPPPLEAAIFGGGDGRGDVHGYAVLEPVANHIFAGGDGRGDAFSAYGLVPVPVSLRVRGLLAGPYVAAQGLMHDSLRVKGLIPLTEPYTDLGFDLAGGGGDEVPPLSLDDHGIDAVVDWVVVELRSAADPSVVEAAGCFLLQRDGDVTDMDLAQKLNLTTNIGAHHIALRHRNHLGVMTADPVELGHGIPLIDLTLPATATYGTSARKPTGVKALLWEGDVNGDGTVKYTGSGNDRDPILQAIGGVIPTNVLHDAYTGEDVNMDGRVQYTGSGNDRDPILQVIGGVVPTNVRAEQLP